MPRSALRERLDRVPQVGAVAWIGVRPGHETPMQVLDAARALEDRGLEGDRVTRSAGGKRQVTLIMSEHLDVIARLLGRDPIDPVLVRRNLVVRGINLRALERMRFRVGDVELEGTGPCEPCAKMDAALGDGAFQAMRGHGGITAKVIVGGTIRIGDPIRALHRAG
jgi:MOSC domain-containing protein YiiM